MSQTELRRPIPASRGSDGFAKAVVQTRSTTLPPQINPFKPLFNTFANSPDCCIASSSFPAFSADVLGPSEGCVAGALNAVVMLWRRRVQETRGLS